MGGKGRGRRGSGSSNDRVARTPPSPRHSSGLRILGFGFNGKFQDILQPWSPSPKLKNQTPIHETMIKSERHMPTATWDSLQSKVPKLSPTFLTQLTNPLPALKRPCRKPLLSETHRSKRREWTASETKVRLLGAESSSNHSSLKPGGYRNEQV